MADAEKQPPRSARGTNPQPLQFIASDDIIEDLARRISERQSCPAVRQPAPAHGGGSGGGGFGSSKAGQLTISAGVISAIVAMLTIAFSAGAVVWNLSGEIRSKADTAMVLDMRNDLEAMRVQLRGWDSTLNQINRSLTRGNEVMGNHETRIQLLERMGER